jgi:hypothetical protein
MNGPVECKHCKHRMDIKGATVEAVEATAEVHTEDRSQYGEYAADQQYSPTALIVVNA